MTLTLEPTTIDELEPESVELVATPKRKAGPYSDAPTRPRSNAGRKTDLERVERQAALEEAERKALRESRRAQPFDPLTRVWLGVTLTIGVIIFITSALFSFATVADVAANWMLPPWWWLAWVVPGFIEAFIVFFGLDAIINQARGRKKDAAAALVWMFVFSTIAVAANAAHTIDGWGGDLSDWRSWIGTAMSALAPLSVVLITKRISKLVFADPEAN